MPQNDPGSFRDPCGRVFHSGDKILRTMNASYQPDWEQACSSGLIERLLKEEKLIRFVEVEPLPGSWKTLEVERIPWISYPYEWSFYQLRDAARLTLDIQKAALSAGMTLKDASAYNIHSHNHSWQSIFPGAGNNACSRVYPASSFFIKKACWCVQ